MEICRLCLLGHNQHINVFADYEPDKNVAAIISKHVSEVCETDPLPKNVCLDCWNRIVSFHEFYEKVHTRQDIYLKDLIKFEQESNFITIPEPVHVNVDAPVPELRDETSIKIEFDDCRNAPLSPNLISCDNDIDIQLQDDGDAFEDETEVTETHSFEHSEEENDLGSEDEK